MLLHYLGKLNIQIFCRYSADTEEMQTNCILSALILIPLCVQLYGECIYVFNVYCIYRIFEIFKHTKA